VPVHILTREALELDLPKLAPSGLVALHLSSRFFDLGPVVAEAAASLGRRAPSGTTPPAALRAAMATERWVPLASQRRSSGGPWLWTDRHSSPLAALRRLSRQVVPAKSTARVDQVPPSESGHAAAP
jgi:hypothetical protein